MGNYDTNTQAWARMLGEQLVAWRTTVCGQTQAAFAADRGWELNHVEAAERGDPTVPMGVWLTIWQEMGTAEQVVGVAAPADQIIEQAALAVMRASG